MLTPAVLHALRQAAWAARSQLQPSAPEEGGGSALEPACLEAPATPPRIRQVGAQAVFHCIVL